VPARIVHIPFAIPEDSTMKLTSIALALGLAIGASAAIAAPQAAPASSATPAPATVPAQPAASASKHHVRHHRRHHHHKVSKAKATKKNDHDADDMKKPATDDSATKS
jgi:hypothetical protein